jgi:hypothetical protein
LLSKYATNAKLKDMKDRWMGSEVDRRTVDGAGVATKFLRWTFLRAVFHRGYVLVSSLYFVINAHLSASQLVILGTVMAVTLLVSDIPAGAWSDAFSRKWPLVIGHGFLAAGMAMTGFVTAPTALGYAGVMGTRMGVLDRC